MIEANETDKTDNTKNNAMLALCRDLVAAQAEFTTPQRSASNPHFRSKYADLNEVINAIQPALTKYGFVLLQPTTTYKDSDGVRYVSVVTTLLHKQGGTYSFPAYDMAILDNKPQVQGSTQSYARRYALVSQFCLPTEDDDGNAASGLPDVPPSTPVAASFAPSVRGASRRG